MKHIKPSKLFKPNKKILESSSPEDHFDELYQLVLSFYNNIHLYRNAFNQFSNTEFCDDPQINKLLQDFVEMIIERIDSAKDISFELIQELKM